MVSLQPHDRGIVAPVQPCAQTGRSQGSSQSSIVYNMRGDSKPHGGTDSPKGLVLVGSPSMVELKDLGMKSHIAKRLSHAHTSSITASHVFR